MDFRYWDSNAFLGWLAEEPDKIDYCRPVIVAAEAGKVRILTSTLDHCRGAVDTGKGPHTAGLGRQGGGVFQASVDRREGTR